MANKSSGETHAGPCHRCGFGAPHRSTSRGWFEQLLFVLGASIARCPQCNARQALLRTLTIPLHSKDSELDLGLRLLPYAFVAGVLTCIAIALWTLRRFHRWPF